jgi:hypothetical protein
LQENPVSDKESFIFESALSADKKLGASQRRVTNFEASVTKKMEFSCRD